MDEACDKYGYIEMRCISHAWMRHVTHMDGIRHTRACRDMHPFKSPSARANSVEQAHTRTHIHVELKSILPCLLAVF